MVASGASACAKPAPPADVVPVDVGELPQLVQVVPDRVPAWVDSRVVLQGGGFDVGAAVRVGGADVLCRVEDTNAIRAVVPALAPGAYDISVTNPTGEVSTGRGALLVVQGDVTACDRVLLAFGAAADPIPGARAGIARAMACLDARDDRVVVEGFARDIGTTELALAHGHRRAVTVAALLVDAGVEARRLAVVSYGAERPQGEAGPEAGVELRSGEDAAPRVGRYGPYGARF